MVPPMTEIDTMEDNKLNKAIHFLIFTTLAISGLAYGKQRQESTNVTRGTLVQVPNEKLEDGRLVYTLNNLKSEITTKFTGKALIASTQLPVENVRLIKAPNDFLTTAYFKSAPLNQEQAIGFDGKNENSRHFVEILSRSEKSNSAVFSLQNNARTFTIIFDVDMSGETIDFTGAEIDLKIAIYSLSCRFLKQD